MYNKTATAAHHALLSPSYCRCLSYCYCLSGVVVAVLLPLSTGIADNRMLGRKAIGAVILTAVADYPKRAARSSNRAALFAPKRATEARACSGVFSICGWLLLKNLSA